MRMFQFQPVSVLYCFVVLFLDCKGLSEEIQLRVVRKFGLPDEMATEVFGLGPDLVDSGSSSHSSKQNTLSRVC